MCLCLLIFFLHSQFHFSSSSSSNSSSLQLCRHDQSVALLQFKNTFSFDPSASSDYCDKPYPKMKSWKEGSDCCSWDGVTCDWVTGHVIGLNLSCSWLNGTIHSNSSLFLLSHLRWLDLDDNDFYSSPISPKFGQFASLTHLNLSYSIFFGPIPSEISHLSKLVSLDLSWNGGCQLETQSLKRLVQNLTELRELSLNEVNMPLVEPGSLMNLSSSLTSLNLGNCRLRGNLPSNIFQLLNLQMLKLNRNYDLFGYFPKINWSSSLEILDFSYTSFSGEVSGLISNLKHLNYLDLSYTSFSGEVPDSIGNLKHLNYLDLYGCEFSGSIPESLGNLTQITHLGFYSKHFISQIPSSLSNLGQLTYLILSGFNFNAQFPALVANLTRLVTLYLSNNTFWGPLPPLVLPNLMDLDLSYNSLNGTIPSWVFTLPSLVSLDLRHNKLSGQIPEFQNNTFWGPLPPLVLPNLMDLHLSYNSLNGTIPSWVFTLPSLLSLDLSGNKFSGHIPEFQNNSLEQVYLDDNELHGPIPRSIFQLVNLTVLSLSSNNLSGIVEVDEFPKLKNLLQIDLSYNSLSWSTTNNVNSTLPKLRYLSLSSCNLSEFPYFLRALENLEDLDLSNNTIHGEIPNWMWDLGKNSLYRLNLSSNLLTRVVQLPWKYLQILDLHSNLIQGPLPIPPLFMNIFLISNNKLTGKIPSLICNLSYLQVLDLSNNNLSGIIPQCLGNFSNSLLVLDLRMNSFHGTIPGTFAEGNSLRTLNFDSNQLEGPVPQSLINCSNLEVLDLGNNKIRDTFPNWLGTLSELRVLVLRSNRFHGVIGDSKTRFPFPKLRIIDLSHNEFIGLLPINYFKNWKAMMMNGDEGKTKLGDYMRQTYYQDSVTVTMKGFEYKLVKILAIFTTMDLSNNKFWGQIPKIIGNLNSLIVLNLSHNSLAGQIPPSLGNLMQIESLDLSSNKLDGGIPSQLTNLTFLAVFNLSHNHLVGPIPRGKQFETFENNSYNENSGLCGFPLSKKCGYDEALEPPPSNEKEDDSEFAGGFGWKAVVMGYGCGMIFGLIIGFLIFLIGKPGWFVRLAEGRRHKKVKRLNKSGHRWAD